MTEGMPLKTAVLAAELIAEGILPETAISAEILLGNENDALRIRYEVYLTEPDLPKLARAVERAASKMLAERLEGRKGPKV